MRNVVGSKQVQPAVRSDLRLPSYEFFTYWAAGGGLPLAGQCVVGRFGKKKKKKTAGVATPARNR
jgi:hypothetical protein